MKFANVLILVIQYTNMLYNIICVCIICESAHSFKNTAMDAKSATYISVVLGPAGLAYAKFDKHIQNARIGNYLAKYHRVGLR